MMTHIPITRTQVCLPPRLRHICWVTGAECRPEQARGFCDPGGQGHQDPAHLDWFGVFFISDNVFRKA